MHVPQQIEPTLKVVLSARRLALVHPDAGVAGAPHEDVGLPLLPVQPSRLVEVLGAQ